MKAQVITALTLLGALSLTAQSENKEVKKETKVRIKKVEKVNGVEKTSDTTYYVNGPVTLDALDKMDGKLPELKSLEPLVVITDEGDEVIIKGTNEGMPEKPAKGQVLIITDEIHGDGYTEVTTSEAVNEEVRKALKDAGVDDRNLKVDKVVVVNSDEKGGKKEMQKIVVIKTMKLSALSAEDEKMLEKTTGISDNKLSLGAMNFYPNPNTGKFNLSFDLKDKGDAEINVLNMEGRTVYNEKLPAFSGHYDKEIDISKQPKGVYFVKVAQGSHSQVKKLVVE